MENTKKETAVNEIRDELKEIMKLSEDNITPAPTTFTVGCSAIFSLICC